MNSTPSHLNTRYLPFLVVAAVLCALVVFAPSKASDELATVNGGGTDFSGTGFDGSDDTGDFSGGELDSGSSADPSTAGGSSQGLGSGRSGSSVGTGTSEASNGSGGSGGGATAGSAAGDTSGSGGSATGGGGQQAAGPDRSNCDANGMQKGTVYPTHVACRPVFSGDNGGATMTGVTETEIRYVWYNPPSNAVVDGILAGAGYARQPEPFCDTMRAFEASAQKYYEMSGRKLVPLDGPGNNAGSADCGGEYKYFQSQCPSNPPDTACFRADAKTIATQLKPAFVLNPRGLPALHEELGRNRIIDIGYGGSRARFQQYAPYLWGTGLGSERMLGLHSEYFCKRLVGDAPQFAGDDVKTLATERTVGLIYPDNGDGSLQPAVDLWVQTVRGCGGNAQTYTYQSDPSRGPQQAQSITAQMRSDGVTTIGFCCDPVSYVFFLQALEQNRYHPEHLVVPVSSIASDVVGQLAGQLGFGEQWKHAFGISNFAINQPDADGEYRRAYADGGGPGGKEGPAAIEIESWNVFKIMMQMIHSGGAQITPTSIFEGMQNLPPIAPTKRTAGYDYAPPDPFEPQRDVAEIWWNPDLRSYYNDGQGAMCYVNGAARYDLGQIPGERPPPLFGGNGQCARLEEYE